CLARALGKTGAAFSAFMFERLFGPLGMTSPLPRFDPAGAFIGSSFCFATPRDFARFGLLYLQDGVWDGRRLLPEGWVDYSRTPAPAANNGVYGAHLWVNLAPKAGQFQPLTGSPSSAFCMSGIGGQFVAVMPGRDLIVVRLGEMQASTWADVHAIIAAVASAFSPVGAEE